MLIFVSNQLTVAVKIEGRKQQQQTYRKPGINVGHAPDFKFRTVYIYAWKKCEAG